jgi:hypothetical protein
MVAKAPATKGRWEGDFPALRRLDITKITPASPSQPGALPAYWSPP